MSLGFKNIHNHYYRLRYVYCQKEIIDSTHITLALHTALQESGFKVVSFNDLFLALQSFKPHELLILDIRMPEMNGFELYRQIKRKDK